MLAPLCAIAADVGLSSVSSSSAGSKHIIVDRSRVWKPVLIQYLIGTA